METGILAALVPLLVPYVTAGLRWIGQKIMGSVPAWLSPFRSLIAGFVVAKVSAMAGVPLPSDLTTITDANSAALINTVVIGGGAHIITNWIDDLFTSYPNNAIIKFIAKWTGRTIANPQPAPVPPAPAK